MACNSTYNYATDFKIEGKFALDLLLPSYEPADSKIPAGANDIFPNKLRNRHHQKHGKMRAIRILQNVRNAAIASIHRRQTGVLCTKPAFHAPNRRWDSEVYPNYVLHKSSNVPSSS